MWCWLAILTVPLLRHAAAQTVIANSALQTCVNNGSVSPLPELADDCKSHRLQLHQLCCRPRQPPLHVPRSWSPRLRSMPAPHWPPRRSSTASHASTGEAISPSAGHKARAASCTARSWPTATAWTKVHAQRWHTAPQHSAQLAHSFSRGSYTVPTRLTKTAVHSAPAAYALHLRRNRHDCLQQPAPNRLSEPDRCSLCPCSATGTCPCSCNYATDAGCTCRDLTQAINVQMTKSPVYASYPLTYAQAFNSKPYEQVAVLCFLCYEEGPCAAPCVSSMYCSSLSCMCSRACDQRRACPLSGTGPCCRSSRRGATMQLAPVTTAAPPPIPPAAGQWTTAAPRSRKPGPLGLTGQAVLRWGLVQAGEADSPG